MEDDSYLPSAQKRWRGGAEWLDSLAWPFLKTKQKQNEMSQQLSHYPSCLFLKVNANAGRHESSGQRLVNKSLRQKWQGGRTIQPTSHYFFKIRLPGLPRGAVKRPYYTCQNNVSGSHLPYSPMRARNYGRLCALIPCSWPNWPSLLQCLCVRCCEAA